MASQEAIDCVRIMMKRVHCFAFTLSLFFGKQAEHYFKQQKGTREECNLVANYLQSTDHTAT